MMASDGPSKGAIPQQVLDSLCSRFILNIPTEESSDLIRAFFQIELAHWFYIDFYRVEQPSLPNLGIRDFAKIIFNHCPSLLEHANEVEDIHAAWKEYKKNVPTYGAILLDDKMQYVLMVQSFMSRTSWGLPKGKVNKDEQPHQCAIREVKEETGFDITELLDKDNYIELLLHDTSTRLYVVPDVPMETVFKPTTRGEIKDVRWFNINDLPAHKKDQAPKVNLGLNPNNFFMVIPFVKPLRKKIASMRGPKSIKSRDSAFTPTILKNPARQAGNESNSAPLLQVQNRENQGTPEKTAKKQKTKQQQVFEQGCKEEWDKYFCGIDDAGVPIGPLNTSQTSRNHQRGKKESSCTRGLKFPTDNLAGDSITAAPDHGPIPRTSTSRVNFNIMATFSLDRGTLMEAFDEGLWGK